MGGLQDASGRRSNASVHRFIASGKPIHPTLEPANRIDTRSAATSERPDALVCLAGPRSKAPIEFLHRTDASSELPRAMRNVLIATGTPPTAFGKVLVATGTPPAAFGKWTSAFATLLIVSRRSPIASVKRLVAMIELTNGASDLSDTWDDESIACRKW
jgi:hypothetical protein